MPARAAMSRIEVASKPPLANRRADTDRSFARDIAEVYQPNTCLVSGQGLASGHGLRLRSRQSRDQRQSLPRVRPPARRGSGALVAGDEGVDRHALCRRQAGGAEQPADLGRPPDALLQDQQRVPARLDREPGALSQSLDGVPRPARPHPPAPAVHQGLHADRGREPAAQHRGHRRPSDRRHAGQGAARRDGRFHRRLRLSRCPPR